MPEPKVSICIPAYRQPHMVQRALASISRQTCRDFEVVVSDDSPDTSVEEAVRDYLHDPRFRYFRNAAPLGSPENWNEAVRHASGEYIKILHHDDWFSADDSLERLVRLLDENPDADFGFSACLACGAGGEVRFVHLPDEGVLQRLRRNPEALFPANVIGAPSVTIYRRGVPETFDPRLKWVVDMDFYMRLLRRNNLFAYDSRPLVSITTDGVDQVSSHCVSDRHIQVYEWVYLYSTLSRKAARSFRNLVFLWRLFKANGIRSVGELREACPGIRLSGLLVAVSVAAGLRSRIRGG